MDCRFRFATPLVNPNLAQNIDEYEEAYLQYLAFDRGDDRHLRALYAWLNRVVPLAGTTLLDVGVGSGKLVRFLRTCRVDAHGIEPSRALFERFLAPDPVFTCATLGDFHSPTGRRFDVVTAFDVIEHVPDPDHFLGDVARALAPGGVFLVSTPDVESLTARACGRWWHFCYAYHLSYFGPRTLGRAAASHGLRLLNCRHRGRLRSVSYMIATWRNLSAADRRRVGQAGSITGTSPSTYSTPCMWHFGATPARGGTQDTAGEGSATTPKNGIGTPAACVAVTLTAEAVPPQSSAYPELRRAAAPEGGSAAGLWVTPSVTTRSERDVQDEWGRTLVRIRYLA